MAKRRRMRIRLVEIGIETSGMLHVQVDFREADCMAD